MRSPCSSSSSRSIVDDRASLGAQLREVARLVLEAAAADDVELAVLADRPIDEVRPAPPARAR